MAELEQYLAEVNEFLEKSRSGYRDVSAVFEKAQESYQKAFEARGRVLQDALKEKGLAVCSGHHFFSGTDESEEWRIKTAEQLGIYPRNQMKLRYSQGIIFDTEHFTMVTSEWMATEVLLLCPKHFPKKYMYLYGTADVPEIYSEVVQKNEKFIIMENGADITGLVNKGRALRSKIELDGDTRPDLAVYRYFGIPDLPEMPDINSVRFGR